MVVTAQAVSNVNDVIGPAILGRDPTEQKAIDNFMVQELDGTKNEWGYATTPSSHCLPFAAVRQLTCVFLP